MPCTRVWYINISLFNKPAYAVFISGSFDIPSTWSCIKAITCIRSGQHTIVLSFVVFVSCRFTKRQWLSCSRSNNIPLRVASGVSVNTLSEIYINKSEIESTSQNNQSENRFFRVFGVKNMAASIHQRFDRYLTIFKILTWNKVYRTSFLKLYPMLWFTETKKIIRPT
jgi:hypothetical protein